MSIDAFVKRIRSLSNEKALLNNSLALANKINEEKGLENTVQFINYRLNHR